MWTDEYGKLEYNAVQDKDVNGILAQCNEIGNISTMPEIPGILVFMKGHVGVYIGNGKVIEAKGHAYGVVETDLNKRPWITYGKLSWLHYIVETEEYTMLDRLCDKYGENNVEKALSRLVETYIDDGNPAPWAVREVNEAKELGLTDASRPEMFTTRQEVMIMCLRAYKKMKGEN